MSLKPVVEALEKTDSKKSVCEAPACEEAIAWHENDQTCFVWQWGGESLNFKVPMMHVECGKHQLIITVVLTPILYCPSNVPKATIQLSVGSESEGEKRCGSRNGKYLGNDAS